MAYREHLGTFSPGFPTKFQIGPLSVVTSPILHFAAWRVNVKSEHLDHVEQASAPMESGLKTASRSTGASSGAPGLITLIGPERFFTTEPRGHRERQKEFRQIQGFSVLLVSVPLFCLDSYFLPDFA
jgi:hypothetical protein